VSDVTPVLAVEGVEVSYGDARAVFGVDLSIAPGGALALLGRNGAGKSSLAAAVGGTLRPSTGRVLLDGVDVTRMSSNRRSRLGIAFVPEERAIFPHLSVLDNLKLRLRHAVPRRERGAALDRAFELFPVLAERRRQGAGTLSGGEQQMLSLARVMAAPPRLLVADEMSLGLAPKMVDLVFETLTLARAEGVTVLLVEQYVERALAFADDAVIMNRGQIAWRGPTSDAGAELVSGYLGA
jgi:branched-chain amino acid transport system ATP-binding protein